MEVEIDVKKVAAVLLSDGWTQVEEKSFEVRESAVFVKDKRRIAGVFLGAVNAAAGWKVRGGLTMACPLTAIQALKLS